MDAPKFEDLDMKYKPLAYRVTYFLAPLRNKVRFFTDFNKAVDFLTKKGFKKVHAVKGEISFKKESNKHLLTARINPLSSNENLQNCIAIGNINDLVLAFLHRHFKTTCPNKLIECLSMDEFRLFIYLNGLKKK
jgi:hypothetical protein